MSSPAGQLTGSVDIGKIADPIGYSGIRKYRIYYINGASELARLAGQLTSSAQYICLLKKNIRGHQFCEVSKMAKQLFYGNGVPCTGFHC